MRVVLFILFGLLNVVSFSQTVETTKAVAHNSVEGGLKVQNGDFVQFRLSEDLEVNGNILTKNSFIKGKVQITGSRILIEIKNIYVNDEALKCNIDVLDIDGYKGIPYNGKGKIPKKVYIKDGHKVLLVVN